MILLQTQFSEGTYIFILMAVAAILAGLIMWLLMRSRIQRLTEYWEERFNGKANELQALQADHTSLQGQLNVLDTQINDFTTKAAELRKEIGSLTLQLETCRSRGKELEGAHNELKAKYNASIGEIEPMRARLADLENTNKTLQDKVTVLTPFQSKFEDSLKEGEDIKARLATLLNEKRELEAKLNSARAASGKSSASNDEILSLKSQIRELDGLKSRIGTLEAELANAQGQNKQLSAQVNTFQPFEAKYNKARQQVADLEDELLKLRGQAKVASQEAQKANEKAKAAEQAAKEAEAEAEKSEKEKDAILARIKAKQESINFDRIGRAEASAKNDLKKIKGIGPFIEEKLNALGIYRFQQIANFEEDDEDRVNEAIEFFPGRVKRDAWVLQAKGLLGDKAAAEEATLIRLSHRSSEINFERIGVATADEKDDLQRIKGIGPFLEKKLNSIKIFTFEQISRFTREDEEKVNDVIEFFPGRISRDEWRKQAKVFADEKEKK